MYRSSDEDKNAEHVKYCNFYPESAKELGAKFWTVMLLNDHKADLTRQKVSDAMLASGVTSGCAVKVREVFKSSDRIGGKENGLLVVTKEFEGYVREALDVYKCKVQPEKPPYPTSGWHGMVIALSMCETIDVYGVGIPRGTYYGYDCDPKDTWHAHVYERQTYRNLAQAYPNKIKFYW